MKNKDLLNSKNEQELERMKSKGNLGIYLSLMADFSGIIACEDFSEKDIHKMLGKKNMLEELAILWQDDERVLELQKILLHESLSSY